MKFLRATFERLIIFAMALVILASLLIGGYFLLTAAWRHGVGTFLLTGLAIMILLAIVDRLTGGGLYAEKRPAKPTKPRKKGLIESAASGMTGAVAFGENAPTVRRMARWFGL